MAQTNITNNNNNTTSECSSISSKDRIKMKRDFKKIKCLDTLAKKYKCTIDTIENIVKGKKRRKTKSILKDNSHLINLLDKVVYEWFQRAQRRIETGTITEEMFLQKAHETKRIFRIANFVTDNQWVWNFRKKYNITNLDMTMLRIENDNKPVSVDISDIVMFVLKNNPVTEYISYNTIPEDNTPETESLPVISAINPNSTQYLYENNNNMNETIVPDNFDETADIKTEVLPVITNDDQARRHLKPLEDYVLLKENFRAIGLISQLEEIFAAEIINEKIVLN